MLFLLLLLSPFAIILRGYVLSVTWTWFVVTTFSLPNLTIPAAIGIATVLQILHPSPSKPDELNKSKSDIFGEYIGTQFLFPLFLLGFCWITKQFL